MPDEPRDSGGSRPSSDRALLPTNEEHSARTAEEHALNDRELDQGEKQKVVTRNRSNGSRVPSHGLQVDADARLAAIVDGSDDAILSKSNEGIVLTWNRGAERLYGWSAEEIIGRPIGTLIPPDRAGEEWDLIESVFSGQAVEHFDTQRVCKDGRIVDVSLTVSPIRNKDGTIVAASTIARDITERKQGEEQRKRAQLEAEAARDDAERANRAKNEFLSRMSHELRTPLNVVLGFAQLLELSDLDESDRQSVRQIVKAGKHLLDLINDVLDISKIEEGGIRLSVEPVDATATIHEVLDLMAPLAAQRKISVVNDVTQTSWVLADLQRLKQVLMNLVSNAIKYNRDGGSVRISVGGSTRVRIEVADTGYGIPADRVDRLFTPFQRLGAERSATEGTGLGLALSKALVEAMGGRLGAETTVGQGSTFWVELEATKGKPASKRESGIWTAAGAAESGAGVPTVLYIEDNVTNVELVEQLVARRPELRLLAAMQGGLGLELARQHSPVVILLDLDLPDIDGTTVLRELRSDPATADTPVVILSADATPERKVELLADGADDYLTKPLNVKLFMRTLDRYVLADAPA